MLVDEVLELGHLYRSVWAGSRLCFCAMPFLLCRHTGRRRPWQRCGLISGTLTANSRTNDGFAPCLDYAGADFLLQFRTLFLQLDFQVRFSHFYVAQP
jgi:hypothetical protein